VKELNHKELDNEHGGKTDLYYTSKRYPGPPR
jgi:hypothetical protein